MNLVHLIGRQWRQRPGRTVLSIASVAIAAAAVLGIALAQESVRLGYRNLLQVTEGRPALEIVAAEGGRFSAALAPDLHDLDEALAVTPLVTRATLARVQGKRFRAVLLGLPVDDQDVWRELPLAEGAPCQEPDEALVSAELAAKLDISIGDRLIILAQRGPRSARIVGTVKSAALRELAPAATLVMPLGAVQQLFGLGDRIDRTRLVVSDSQHREALQATIAERLPEGLIVQAPLAQLDVAGNVLKSTEMALQFAGALSMAMASMIVLHTLRMNFNERRRDMAVLRVLGAAPRDLVRLQLLEGFCLGLIGAVVGAPLGVLLGRGLGTLMGRLARAGVEQPDIPYRTLVLALVVGPIVASIAALLPALQSRRISPIEAMGDVEARRGERFPLWASASGACLWCIAASLLAMVITERVRPQLAIPAGVLMLFGFICVIPVLQVPLVRLFAMLVQRGAELEGGYAAEQLLRRPTRTGLTVGVLVAAVSTSVGMGNAILTNVEDVRSWYQRAMAGDVLLWGSQLGEASGETRENSGAREKIAAQPGVDSVVEIRYLPSRVDVVPAICTVRDFPAEHDLPWVVSPAESAEIRAGLEAGEAVVAQALAKKSGLAAGQTMRLEVQGRALPIRVAAVVRDYSQGGLVVFVNRTSAAKWVELGPADLYIVRSTPGTAVDGLIKELDSATRDEGLVVQSFAEMRQKVDSLIDGIVAALWGLLAIGFAIGGIAVANTLTMSVLEQTRELGLLRIVGMTQRQTRLLILCESALLGLLGTLLGTVAGLTTAFVIHICNEPLLGLSLPFSLHTWLVATLGCACFAITLLAAWLPGARAAHIDLLSAIRFD